MLMNPILIEHVVKEKRKDLRRNARRLRLINKSSDRMRS